MNDARRIVVSTARIKNAARVGPEMPFSIPPSPAEQAEQNENEEAALSPEWLSNEDDDEAGQCDALPAASASPVWLSSDGEGAERCNASPATAASPRNLRVVDLLGHSNNWPSHTFGEGSTVAADLESIREELDSALSTSRFLGRRLSNVTVQLLKEKERNLMTQTIIRVRLWANRRIERRACWLSARRRAASRLPRMAFATWRDDCSDAMTTAEESLSAASLSTEISQFALRHDSQVLALEGTLRRLSSAIMQKVQEAAGVCNEIAVLETSHKQKRDHIVFLERALANSADEVNNMRTNLEKAREQARQEVETLALDQETRRTQMHATIERAEASLHCEHMGRLKLLVGFSDLENIMARMEDTLDAWANTQARKKRHEEEQIMHRQQEIDRQTDLAREMERASRRLSISEVECVLASGSGIEPLIQAASPSLRELENSTGGEGSQLLCERCRAEAASGFIEAAGGDLGEKYLVDIAHESRSDQDDFSDIEQNDPQMQIGSLRAKYLQTPPELNETPFKIAHGMIEAIHQLVPMLEKDDAIIFQAKRALKRQIMQTHLNSVQNLAEKYLRCRRQGVKNFLAYVQGIEQLTARSQAETFHELLEAGNDQLDRGLLSVLAAVKTHVLTSIQIDESSRAYAAHLENSLLHEEVDEGESEDDNQRVLQVLARFGTLQQGLITEGCSEARGRLKRIQPILLHCIWGLTATPTSAALWFLSYRTRKAQLKARKKGLATFMRKKQQSWVDAWRTYTNAEGQPKRDTLALDAAMAQLEVLRHRHLEKLEFSTMLRLRHRLECLALETWKALLAVREARHRRNSTLKRVVSRMSSKALALAFDSWCSGIEESLALMAQEERKQSVKSRILLRCSNRCVSRALRTWSLQVLAGVASRTMQAAGEEKRMIIMKSVVKRFQEGAVRKAFCKWRRGIQEECRKRQIMIRLVLRLRNRLMAMAAGIWRQQVLTARAQRTEEERRNAVMARVLLRLQKVSLARAMSNWSNTAESDRAIREHIDFGRQRRAQELLVTVLCEWQSSLQDAQKESSKSSATEPDSAVFAIECKNKEMEEYVELVLRKERSLSARHSRMCAQVVQKALQLHLERAMEDFVFGVMVERRETACVVVAVARFIRRRLFNAFLKFKMSVRWQCCQLRAAQRRMRIQRLRHALKEFVNGVEASCDQLCGHRDLQLQDLSHPRRNYISDWPANAASKSNTGSATDSASPGAMGMISGNGRDREGVAMSTTSLQPTGASSSQAPPVAVMCYFSKWKMLSSASTLRRVSLSFRTAGRASPQGSPSCSAVGT